MNTLTLFPEPEQKVLTLDDCDYNSYDIIIVAFSGGKDSLAALLHLIKIGVDLSKVELWHHDVDGREGSSLMDWKITRPYIQAVAKHFGLPIYFSWREGGFEKEMNRDYSLTGNVIFESPTGLVKIPSTDRPEYYNTRKKFPQVSADLSTRWCSSYLKIMISESVLRNDTRFIGKRTLFVTGERGEESSNRAKYNIFEPHKADLRHGKKYQRHIDHARIVLRWLEEDVWKIIEEFSIHPHPAYYLGFSRTSCMACIFLNADGFKTVQFLDPKKIEKLSAYEESFGITIKRKESLKELIKKGTIYAMDENYIAIALSEEWTIPIVTDNWTLPIGAYKKGCGPS